MSAPEYEEYIQAKLTPVLESLVTEVLLAHPEDPVTFMISRLCQRAKLPDPTTLAASGSKENEELRQELARLREDQQRVVALDTSSNRSTHDTDDSEEEEEADDEEQESFEAKYDKIRGFNKMRQSVCAEVYGNWNKKQKFEPPVYPKTDEQKERLHKVLGLSFMFSCLDNKDRNTVVDAMKERQIPADMTLIKQGADGDCLYIVETGSLQCWREDGGRETMVKVVGPGDVFGELALLYNAPRAATVKSAEDCKLWRLDRDTFNAIVKDAATKKREMYDAFLSKVRLLESMSTYDRIKLADALRTEEYQGGEFIVRQGEPGDIFYLIEEGSAIAMKVFEGQTEPQEVETYKAGDYFGELALLTGEPRAASVIAKGSCKVATLDRKSFKRLMGSVEEILKRKAQEYKKQPQ
ncbi:cAMP-dependent protein kinase regulatory subunit [Cyclospora cayetanensis]|uniref:cAMP-dependent protein kinase regulatory subunit n=1 Tax=Cyclospora cayetanensis TaxID=88456 RepID=A0A6P6RPT2_9EIME|nr:cAMP-dependent protein kinase regulatory subunit [Cyclospora cayetanensis]